MNTDKNKKKILKVIYLDENSAGDYLNILEGGLKDSYIEASSSKELLSERSSFLKLDLLTYSLVLAGLIGSITIDNAFWNHVSVVIAFLSILGKAVTVGYEVSSKRKQQTKNLVNTQVKSTILTEFIKKSKVQDSGISILDDLRMQIEPNSFTQIRYFSPWSKLIKIGDGIELDKLDEVISDLKGYYEITAIMQDGSKSIIRLNLQAFRNNYKLTDLIHMDLKFLGLKVGNATLKDITFANTLNVNNDTSPVNGIDVVQQIEGEEEKSQEKLVIYDIILAYIES